MQLKNELNKVLTKLKKDHRYEEEIHMDLLLISFESSSNLSSNPNDYLIYISTSPGVFVLIPIESNSHALYRGTHTYIGA